MADLEAVRAQYDESRSADQALRRQGREAAARRRAAAGRDEDGQGVRRGEAQAAAGRQDGRPPRQQGRDLRSCRSRTCRSSRTAPGRHRAQPARRAEPHERRPDPRDPSRLGRARPRQADRRDARSHPAKGEASRRRRQAGPGEAEDEIYGKAYHAEIDAHDDDETAGARLQPDRGVPIGTPVFDGAKEADISAMLEMAGLDSRARSPCSTAAPASRSTAR
jgi:DNA-directed RNA polymerase beta subunit